MHNYKELRVWNKSVTLATDIYEKTKSFPKDEIYGIPSQLRRSAISISSNIAEGAGRSGKKGFRHFLNISLGSSFELETQIIISKKLEYIDGDEFHSIKELVIEIQKMLYMLIKSIEYVGA